MVICTKRFWNQVTNNKSHTTKVTQKLNCNREMVVEEKVSKPRLRGGIQKGKVVLHYLRIWDLSLVHLF